MHRLPPRLFAVLVSEFAVLLTALLLTGVLLTACGSEAPMAANAIRVSIVDHKGNPANWADVVAQYTDKEFTSKWDAQDGVMLLPRESAPHSLRVSAPGHRLLQVSNINDDLSVTLPRGIAVHLDVQIAAVLPKPRAILLRIRPAVKGDPKTDSVAAAKISEMSELMWIIKEQDDKSLPTFPTKHWGFGVSPSDAAKGIYFPVAGSFVVHWGLLDLDEGTWYTVEEQSQTVLRIKDQSEPQHFTIVIDEDTMQATNARLQEQIDAIKAQEVAKK